MIRELKYPLALFIVLLLAKLAYIYIESVYNFDVLSITTDSELSQPAIENLNVRGHVIASIGFTLFLIPLFFLFIKQKKQVIQWFSIAVFSAISFTIFYHSLNYSVDYIVKKNQDKRYEAYYTNLLKYGIINGVIYYNSFIPKERLDNPTVNDKILLTNIFLLSNSDSNLINKFREKGEKNTIELYLQKYKRDDFQDSFNKFKEMFSEIEDRWIEFNNEKLQLLKQLGDLNTEKATLDAFENMTRHVTDSFNNYQKAYKGINQKVSEQTSLKDLSEIKSSLEKYFRYQSNQKAVDQYRARMIEDFGHYIEPRVWKNKDGLITYPSIVKVIREQIEFGIKEKVLGLESGLTNKEFLNQRPIKIEVAKELKKNNILIPYDFDYSYSQFKEYFDLMKNKVLQNSEKEFNEALEKKIGISDLTLETDWKAYITSEYLENKILNKIGNENRDDLELYQKVLLSKDLNNFRSMIYIPKALTFTSENIIYEEKQFENNSIISQKGDQAIKLLYIPPIALGLSILALLLNIFTVVGMLLQLFLARSKIFIGIIQLTLITIIVFTPLTFQDENLQNKMLSKTTNPALILTLQWASYWERVNYMLHIKNKT